MVREFKITKKQKSFIDSCEDEVLYGGAAGGGKTYAQIMDAFIKAVTYPGIRQIIFRNSYPELNRSVILNALSLIPKELFTYSGTEHRMRFYNSSLIEFGYLASDSDVTNYQSAEYDIIRFDELTHFSEYQYRYMRSRLRGANSFPKQIKSSTNPGSRGHGWVKAMFIEKGEPNVPFRDGEMTRVFIPARVGDNSFLTSADPGYIKRLETLPENEKRALLYGEWDIFEGQFFPEFKNDSAHYKDRLFTHVIAPFRPPDEWRIYRSFDFGYARPYSAAWWAVDYDRRLYRILELYGCAKDSCGEYVANTGVRQTPGEIFSLIAETEKTHPYLRGKKIMGVADPSIWDKSRGTSVAEEAEKKGIYFEKGDNTRRPGWMQVHYRLRFDERGIPMMYVFSNCRGFIKTFPALVYSKTDPEDLDTEGEDHIADEVRYMCMAHPLAPEKRCEAKAPAFSPLSDEGCNYNYYLI